MDVPVSDDLNLDIYNTKRKEKKSVEPELDRKLFGIVTADIS